jgi:hypothetical protein
MNSQLLPKQKWQPFNIKRLEKNVEKKDNNMKTKNTTLSQRTVFLTIFEQALLKLEYMSPVEPS